MMLDQVLQIRLYFLDLSKWQAIRVCPPAFATGIITAKFEKWLRKHVPDAIDSDRHTVCCTSCRYCSGIVCPRTDSSLC